MRKPTRPLAPFAHLAVSTPQGPHVTPQAVGWWGGRLWCTTSRTSVKAKHLQTGDRVGLVVRWADDVAGGLCMVGEVRRVDLASPIDRARAALAYGPLEVDLAIAGYAAANARYLVGYARDVAQLPAAWLASNRVAFAIEPDGWAELTGGSVRAQGGRWPSADAAEGPVVVPPPPSGIPAPAAEAWDRAPQLGAVVGGRLGGSLVALPATAVQERGGIELGVPLGLAPGGFAACVDRAAVLRPTGMTGLLARGELDRDGRAQVARWTWWEGWRSGTVRTRRPTPAAAAGA